jgi:hypothetical protein
MGFTMYGRKKPSGDLYSEKRGKQVTLDAVKQTLDEGMHHYRDPSGGSERATYGIRQ